METTRNLRLRPSNQLNDMMISFIRKPSSICWGRVDLINLVSYILDWNWAQRFIVLFKWSACQTMIVWGHWRGGQCVHCSTRVPPAEVHEASFWLDNTDLSDLSFGQTFVSAELSHWAPVGAYGFCVMICVFFIFFYKYLITNKLEIH